MKRFTVLMILISLAFCVSAQEKAERQIELWGHVKSALIKQGILDSKVTLMHEDSTIVDTMTVFREWHDDNKIDAAYKFKIPAKRATYIIKAEHPDYETTYVRWKMPVIGRNTYFDAPWHLMKPRRKKDYAMEGQLDEVVIQKTRVKVFTRGDTLIYNADAFNLPEGSMLDELIKQLPGAELKDGQIFVNGKKIDELTLNGKDFFGNNTKVMLENLPLYTVNQLKVFNKSTDRSEWLGREVEQKKYVMDVVLKRQYNVGFIGNATVAGGTENLWLARLFGLRYTDNSRLILYGSSNNINSTAKPENEKGSWWEYGAGSNGRTQASSTGFSLMVDDKEKRFRNEIAVVTDWKDDHLETKTNSEQYMANGYSTFNRSNSDSKNKNFELTVSNRFKTANPLKSWHTHANIDFHLSNQDGKSHSFSEQTNIDSVIVNRNQTLTMTDGHSISANGNFGIWHKTPWGDDGGINFRPSASREKRHSYLQQHIVYLTQAGQDINQNRYSPNDPTDAYSFDIAPYYSINLLHGFTLYTDYTYTQKYQSQNNETYLLNRLSGYDAMGNSLGTLPSTRDSMQMALDINNSNHQTSLRRMHAPAASLTYQKESEKRALWSRLYLTLRHFNDRLHYASIPTDTILTQRYFTIEPDLRVNHRWKAQNDSSYTHYINFHYNMRETPPSLFHQVDVRNDQDPLHIRLGNPDLKGTLSHSFSVNYNKYRSKPYRYYSINASVDVLRNNISQGYSYEPTTGVYTYRPMNVNGNWTAKLILDTNRSLDKKDNYIFSGTLNGSYSQNVDYAAVAGKLSHVNNWNLYYYQSIAYRKGGNLANVYGRINYRYANQKEGTIDNVNTVDFSYGVTGQLQLFKNAWISTTLNMNSKRGYNDSSLNRNDLIWNAYANINLLKNSLTLKLEAYDLLHQLSNINVNINGQGRTETTYNTLPRYIMLRLTYKLQKYPKNTKK